MSHTACYFELHQVRGYLQYMMLSGINLDSCLGYLVYQFFKVVCLIYLWMSQKIKNFFLFQTYSEKECGFIYVVILFVL
jgi:hypothetical protein